MTQSPSIYGDLTARENLRYFARVLGAPADAVETALADVSLLDHADAGRRPAVRRRSGRVSRSRPRCSVSPSCSSSTSRRSGSTRSCGATCGSSSTVSPRRDARCSSPATSWTRPTAATRSCCCARAVCSRRRRPAELRARTGADELDEAFLRLVEERRRSRERSRHAVRSPRRVLAQLRRDPRTLALILVVARVLVTLLELRCSTVARPSSTASAPPLLGLFPFVTMFLVTSITMLRERTTGHAGAADDLAARQARPARRLRDRVRAAVAVVQAAIVSARRVRAARPRSRGAACSVVALAVAQRGARHGARPVRRARSPQTEFQAVQFMPAFVFPQILLCGLFVAARLDGARGSRDLRRAAAHLRLRRAGRVTGGGHARIGASARRRRGRAARSLLALALGAATLRRRTP